MTAATTESAAQTGQSGGDIMREFLKVSPFVGHLGIKAVSLAPDLAVLELPFSEPIITIGDTVHGGAISTLVDTAAMAAAWCTETPPASLRGTTVSLNVSFTTAARAVDLTATARVLRRGKNLSAVDVDVTNPSGELVAKGLVTYKLG